MKVAALSFRSYLLTPVFERPRQMSSSGTATVRGRHRGMGRRRRRRKDCDGVESCPLQRLVSAEGRGDERTSLRARADATPRRRHAAPEYVRMRLRAARSRRRP